MANKPPCLNFTTSQLGSNNWILLQSKISHQRDVRGKGPGTVFCLTSGLLWKRVLRRKPSSESTAWNSCSHCLVGRPAYELHVHRGFSVISRNPHRLPRRFHHLKERGNLFIYTGFHMSTRSVAVADYSTRLLAETGGGGVRSNIAFPAGGAAAWYPSLSAPVVPSECHLCSICYHLASDAHHNVDF